MYVPDEELVVGIEDVVDESDEEEVLDVGDDKPEEEDDDVGIAEQFTNSKMCIVNTTRMLTCPLVSGNKLLAFWPRILCNLPQIPDPKFAVRVT